MLVGRLLDGRLRHDRDDRGCQLFSLIRRHELFLLDYKAVVLKLSDPLHLLILNLRLFCRVVGPLLIVVHVSKGTHELRYFFVLRSRLLLLCSCLNTAISDLDWLRKYCLGTVFYFLSIESFRLMRYFTLLELL